MILKLEEQLICCIFAVILFCSGMCVEVPYTGTLFLYASKIPTNSSAISVYKDGTLVSAVGKVLTFESLRYVTITNLANNQKTDFRKKFLRIAIVIWAAKMLLAQLFYVREAVEFASRKIKGSHVAIIRYIQQKDGKK